MTMERVGTHIPPHDDTGVGATIVQVAEDAKSYATAQIDLYKAIASARLTAAKSGIIFLVAAAVLAIAAIGGLVVGAILALATLVGPGWATLIVVVVMLAIAGVLGKMAASRLSRAFGAMQ